MKRNQVEYKLALSICSLKCALFPFSRRNAKAEYIMLTLSFPHLAICIAYFNCRRKHLSFQNEISIFSRTFSESQNHRSLKKFLPDRDISIQKESAKHRYVKIASNRHSANENKQVEGQFSGRCFFPDRKSIPPPINRPSEHDFFSPDGRTPPAASHASLPLSFQTSFLLSGWSHTPAAAQLSMQYAAPYAFCIEI